MTRTEHGDGWSLTLGDWRDHELPMVDAVIEDPPYGKRVHAGQSHGTNDGRAATALTATGNLGYDHWEPQDVTDAVAAIGTKCFGWCVWLTSHDLIPHYELALTNQGRCTFAPLPIVIPGMSVRLAGDGPSNWSVYAVVSRTKRKKCWSTKDGAYVGHTGTDRRESPVKGAKPLSLMEAILRDYTDPGDLVLDRFAGGGTTGVAAIRLGRRFHGYERKPEHFEIALKRLRAAREQRQLFSEGETR